MSFDYEQLDAGVRDVVRRLHDRGWATSDSGDGVSKPDGERVLDFPHVAVTNPTRYPHGDLVIAAHDIAEACGEGWICEVSYSTESGNWIALAMLRPEPVQG